MAVESRRNSHRLFLIPYIVIMNTTSEGFTPHEIFAALAFSTLCHPGSSRVVPHRIVHAEPDKPAEQQAVIDPLDQLPTPEFWRHRWLSMQPSIKCQSEITCLPLKKWPNGLT
jgi:hypothetical protein